MQCGNHYDRNNPQHVSWLKTGLHSIYLMGGKALCAYTDDNAPIGFLLYQHDRGLENTCCFGKKAHIKMFEVKEDFRSEGIGKVLLNQVCGQVRSDGGECLYTDTYAPDKITVKFYIENDFVPVAVHEGENGINDYDQLYLYKVLVKD